MDIHAKGGELRGGKEPGVHLLPVRLNCRIGSKQGGEVQHRHVKRLADEVACLVDRDVMRGFGVAVHDENPFEAVLRQLSAQIGHERPQRRLSDRVGAGVDQPVADDVCSALTVVEGRHHDDVPIWQGAAHAMRHPHRPVHRVPHEAAGQDESFGREIRRPLFGLRTSPGFPATRAVGDHLPRDL